jgi:hypothetical protein
MRKEASCTQLQVSVEKSKSDVFQRLFSEVQVGNKFGVVDYVFNATHPFLFFLEEQTKGTILFVGKVENPLETNAVPIPPRFGDSQGKRARGRGRSNSCRCRV